MEECAAEFLAVELILPSKTKVIVATCYRVCTLGMPNCKEVLEVLGKLSRKKMLRKFIVIGDFNLNGVTWATGSCKNSVEKEFILILLHKSRHDVPSVFKLQYLV